VIYDFGCNLSLTYDKARFEDKITSASEWVNTSNDKMLIENYGTMLVNDKLENKTIKMKFAKTAYISFTNITCQEVWLFIILKMRKSCINDKTIAKIMIIREEFYSKNVMWSVLRYNTSSNHSHILIWRWIILIELIWWFQSLSKNSIIIKARNLIIKLTI
jgi:hypothetical protein